MTDNAATQSEPVSSAAPKKPRKPRKPPTRDPILKLSKASAQAVLKNSKEIAQKLLESTLEGDMSSTKMLVALAEKCPVPKRKKNWSELIEMLACPPELLAPANELENHLDENPELESSSGE